MTDIVEQPDRLLSSVVSVMAEAVDEIERLRKEVAGAMILADMLRDAALGHQERAERLRAALHRISLASQNSGTTKEFLGREARAALAKEFDNEADK